MIQQAYNSLSAKVFTSSIWFGLIGAGIAIALLSASFQYLKRGLQLGKAIRDGIWVGFLAGAIAGELPNTSTPVLDRLNSYELSVGVSLESY